MGSKPHNHKSDQTAVEVSKTRQACIERALTSSDTPGKIFSASVSGLDPATREAMPTAINCKQAIRYRRRKYNGAVHHPYANSFSTETEPEASEEAQSDPLPVPDLMFVSSHHNNTTLELVLSELRTLTQKVESIQTEQTAIKSLLLKALQPLDPIKMESEDN